MRRLPISALLILAVLGIALLGQGAIVVLQRDAIRASALESMHIAVRNRVLWNRGMLETLARAGRLGSMQDAVTTSASWVETLDLHVVDPDGIVVASSSNRLVGQPLLSREPGLAPLVARTLASDVVQVETAGSGDSLWASVRYCPVPEEIATDADRCGYIALHQDAGWLLATRYRDALSTTLTALLVTLLSCIAILWVLERALVRPLERLRGALDAFVAGRREARAPTSPWRETAQVAETVNRVLGELEREEAAGRRVTRNLELAMSAVNRHALVSSTDTEGRIRGVNARFVEVSGYSEQELLGRPYSLFNSGSHPPSFWASFWDTIRRGEEWHGEICNRRRDDSLFWVQCTVIPRLDAGGQIEEYIVVATDVTELYTAQQSIMRLQRQLVQAQKMEAIGQLTGGIAHDFNNILASVLGYAGLGLQRAQAGGDEKQREYLGQIERAARRAAALVAKMLAFSRAEATQRRVFSLRPAVEEVMDLLRPVMPATIDVRLHCAVDDAWTDFDPVQFQQVMINVCINARDAMSGSGDIEITLDRISINDRECASCHAALDGGYYVVVVRDSGPGIPIDIQRRMFDPFFTTKEVGKGSGMGLSMVHGLMHASGGHVLVRSRTGSGAEIALAFVPADPDGAASTERRESGEQERLDGVTIAVVDDEPALGAMLQEMLGACGAEVLRFDGGAALLEEIALGMRPDLVLTDITMPGMNGVTLRGRLLDASPASRVVAMSGFSERVDATNFAELGFDAFIAKPVSRRKLLEVCARVVRAARAQDAT